MSITIGSEYEDVSKRLGEPSSVSVSEDGLKRLLSFADFNVYYEFRQGRVVTFGIFEPSMGPKRVNEVLP